MMLIHNDKKSQKLRALEFFHGMVHMISKELSFMNRLISSLLSNSDLSRLKGVMMSKLNQDPFVASSSEDSPRTTDKKQRSTCIVELNDEQGQVCILISKQTGDRFAMVPGGGVDQGEAPIISAVRELKEESDLACKAALKLFEHESAFTFHHVFLLIADGQEFKPCDDVEQLWLMPLTECEKLGEHDELSRSTKIVLKRYLQWRRANQEVLKLLKDTL